MSSGGSPQPDSHLGQHLGAYRIDARIGEGGMGEVYRAHDAKLGRDVAIKVLPREYARDAERLARFRREARALAALNHSNIAAIYGLEESGGTPGLVMELVPGETLAERIKKGPVPLREALEIAQQIATGLEHAHEKGIIHRDLKPANVKITAAGTVKLLDFGLAKAFVGEGSGPQPDSTDDVSTHDLLRSQPPAGPSAAPTASGIILGTPAYMSPEQARGQQVDKRTDIWALGCILYEMLTGRPAFSGPTITDIL